MATRPPCATRRPSPRCEKDRPKIDTVTLPKDGPAGDELGHIDDVMIDATSGKIVRGMLQLGGFPGINLDYYPLPFGKLRYGRALGGYVTDLTREQLESAPAWAEDWRGDRECQRRAYEYYRLPPYW